MGYQSTAGNYVLGGGEGGESGASSWNIPTLAYGSIDTLTITARVEPGAKGQTIINAVALEKLFELDKNPSNDFSTVSINVLAAQIVVAGFPTSVIAGNSYNFTVTVDAGYRGTLTFNSSASKAVLPANYTFTSADAGVHTFSAILRSAGSQSITATDIGTSSISGSQSGIVVNPAATDHLVVSRFPYKTTAGVAQSFRITAQDLFGNTTPGFTDTVTFSSSDSQAVLPANYPFITGDAGVHNFSATLETAGSESITAQDSTNSRVAAGSLAGITVNPASTSQLQVSGFPPFVKAGVSYAFTVTAKDPFGNTTPGYKGTVTFTSTDSQSVLPANYVFTSTDGGLYSFPATMNTLGTQTISATDMAHAGITGSESMIVVQRIQPTAGLAGPSMGVPGQPLAYALSASESGLPAGTVYSYRVQWGDGSPVQAFSGPSGTLASHIYTAPAACSISVTATDSNGHSSVPVSTSVSITTVAMETDPYDSSLTALYVGGTLGNDTIAITPATTTGGVKVGMNFVNYGSFFPPATWSSIANRATTSSRRQLRRSMAYLPTSTCRSCSSRAAVTTF